MIGSNIERAAMLVVVTLALAVGCPSPEPANKAASADKPKPAEKAKDDDKAKGGGGSDVVAKAEPVEEEPEQPPEDPNAGYDPRVVKAAEVAREIASDPSTADDVLAKADLDREKLDALMYEIASDPDLTEQYRIARGL